MIMFESRKVIKSSVVERTKNHKLVRDNSVILNALNALLKSY